MLIFKKHIEVYILTLFLVLSFSCKKDKKTITTNVPNPVEETEQEFVLENIYIVSESGTNLNIYNYDLNSIVFEKTIASDYGGVFCNSRDKEIIIAGLSDDIKAYDLDYNEQWTIASKNTSFPFFHFLNEGKGDYFSLFVSNEDKEIRSYNENGIQDTKLTVSEVNLYPYQFGNVESGYTFVDVKDYSKSTEELHVYYTPTGFFQFKHDFKNKELIGVGDLGANTNSHLLFINDTDVGKIYNSNISTYVSNEIKNITSKILAVLTVSQTEYFIATELGLGIYNQSNNSFAIVNSIVFDQLYLNKEDGRVIGVETNKIHFLDDSGNTMQTVSNSEPISGIGLMYE